MSIQPTEDNVVIKLPRTIEQTGGGLWIPGVAQNPSHEGTVLARGPKCDPEVEVGCRVMIEAFAGLEVTDEEHGEVVMVRDCDIIAILEA